MSALAPLVLVLVLVLAPEALNVKLAVGRVLLCVVALLVAMTLPSVVVASLVPDLEVQEEIVEVEEEGKYQAKLKLDVCVCIDVRSPSPPPRRRSRSPRRRSPIRGGRRKYVNSQKKYAQPVN